MRGEKRARILEAAVQAFSREGYHQTRISDIAKAANVADGTVYLYFASKAELLSTIFEDRMERFLQVGREEVAEDRWRADQAAPGHGATPGGSGE